MIGFLKKFAVRGSLACAAVFFAGLGFLNFPSFQAPADQEFGVTFSPGQAEWLGLDWRETYTAILDDLGVKKFRLSAYWNMIEPERGVRDFSALDYQLDEAAKRGVRVILAVGRKVPRWPECHDPPWLNKLSRDEQEGAVQDFIAAVVTRYRDHAAIEKWQVENEILFPFGICPEGRGLDHLAKEVALVRSLDTRPIVISDSGEWTLWLPIALYGDVLGSSLYREAWNTTFGRIPFPIRPGYYQVRAAYLNALGKEVIITELQAEPWGEKSLIEMSVSEAMAHLPMSKFEENIKFAKEVGFSEVYLWGVEWWYAMKQSGVDVYWDRARTLFREGE